MTENRITDRQITDGFGSTWSKCAAKNCALQVVRPGKVQCACDNMEMPPEDAETLSETSGIPFPEVCFIVKATEHRIREVGTFY